MAGPVERSAVLPDDPHLLPRADQVIHAGVVGLAPAGTVQEQHIGALRFGHGHPREVLPDKADGVIDVLFQYLAQFIHPLGALPAVSRNQRVHRQHVHGVVVGKFRLGHDLVPQARVVDDVVRADQAGQVEGLGGGIEGHRAAAGVF